MACKVLFKGHGGLQQYDSYEKHDRQNTVIKLLDIY